MFIRYSARSLVSGNGVLGEWSNGSGYQVFSNFRIQKLCHWVECVILSTKRCKLTF